MKQTILVLIVSLVLAGAGQAQTQGQPHIYVAIGDSLAFGFQQDKFTNEILTGTYDPASFNTGYVDVLGTILRGYVPTLEIANFSCPGETSVTMAIGGCPMHNTIFSLPLHQDYPAATPQLRAAVDYLQAHPNDVLLITLTIGANDILNLISNCNKDATCVNAQINDLSQQVANVIKTEVVILKTVAPTVQIYWTTIPNPYRFTNPDLQDAFFTFNYQLKVSIVGGKPIDWFAVENSLDQATFCTLTYVCTPPTYDIHPTDFGYQFLGWWVALNLQ
jgi:lysophospholipase L1-like esterase